MRNCNFGIGNGEMGNISEGLWRSMTNLGITNILNDFDPVARLEELERKKSKGVIVNKWADIRFP